MRTSHVLLLLAASVGFCGCVSSWSKPQASVRWATGFWLWQGTYEPSEWNGVPLDVLFVEVGSITPNTPFQVRQAGEAGRWSIYGSVPGDLPKARDYWLVFRAEQPSVPDSQTARKLAEQVPGLLVQARQSHFKVAGIQLDIDSPTGALRQYGSFLREVKKGLPQGVELSITALLDWFRPGTAVAEVIREVDEFVPQFYDIDAGNVRAGTSIAAKIDAARWGPVFNNFGKRFRIGISTFGRARLAPDSPTRLSERFFPMMFRDLIPLDVATNPAFRLETSRNPANELVLTYRAVKKVRFSFMDFAPGDGVQFILASPEGVRAAVASVRQMRGNVTGVVFFRWPGGGEVLTMQPQEVMLAAAVQGSGQRAQNRVDVVDGRCAAVECVDVYLEAPPLFSPKTLRFRVHSSAELEYFLPEKDMPIRMTGPSELELALPPYCGRGHLYLGRAVTLRRAEFEVTAEP